MILAESTDRLDVCGKPDTCIEGEETSFHVLCVIFVVQTSGLAWPAFYTSLLTAAMLARITATQAEPCKPAVVLEPEDMQEAATRGSQADFAMRRPTVGCATEVRLMR